MLLLLLTFVPHHHHHGIACVIMEHCELDNAVNDKNTSHNDAPDKGQQGQSCVAELEYIASTSDKEVIVRFRAIITTIHTFILS
jgi:hypothetical protein